jgi:hypothetical protein
MPSSASTPPSHSPHTPRWVRAADLVCLLLIALAAIVAMSGGFRQRVGDWRIAVTSPYPLLLWALAIGVLRHVVARSTPVYQDLPRRVVAWWSIPGVRTAAAAVVGTRPAILFVGYLAVLMIGYAPGTDPPRQLRNELLNLPARWDANWYLGIVTEGYHYESGQAGQQSIAFFPAYPMLVRGVGRLFGGEITGYMAAGLTISLVAFFGALVYLYGLARDTLSDDEAKFALWLVAAYPFAIFFGAVYTESLFLLGMTATFYHFSRAECGRATLWGVVVGLTKTNGFVLSIPLAVLAVSPWLPERIRGGNPFPVPSRPGSLSALLAVVAPAIGALAYSAFLWRLTGSPFAWLEAHLAWGRKYQGLAVLIGDRYNIIANAGIVGYASAMPHDLVNLLGVLFVLATTWPVARRIGLAYAVFILVIILPPLAAGGLISAGRFSSVVFPAFIWMAGAVPPGHRTGWLASFAAFQAFNAALFYTWRPLY